MAHQVYIHTLRKWLPNLIKIVAILQYKVNFVFDLRVLPCNKMVNNEMVDIISHINQYICDI